MEREAILLWNLSLAAVGSSYARRVHWTAEHLGWSDRQVMNLIPDLARSARAAKQRAAQWRRQEREFLEGYEQYLRDLEAGLPVKVCGYKR